MTLRAPDARISPSVSSGQLSSTRVVATRRTGPLQWLKEAAGPPLLHRPRHLRIEKAGGVFNIEQVNPLHRDNNAADGMRRAPMLDYIHNANIDLYRRLIAESERNPRRD